MPAWVPGSTVARMRRCACIARRRCSIFPPSSRPRSRRSPARRLRAGASRRAEHRSGAPAAHDRTWLAAAHDGGAGCSRASASSSRSCRQIGRRHAGARPARPLGASSARRDAAGVALDYDSARVPTRPRSRAVPDAARRARPGAIVLRGRGTDEPRRAARDPSRARSSVGPGAIDLACTAPEPAYAVVSRRRLPGLVRDRRRSLDALANRRSDAPRGPDPGRRASHRVALRDARPRRSVSCSPGLASRGLVALWLREAMRSRRSKPNA